MTATKSSFVSCGKAPSYQLGLYDNIIVEFDRSNSNQSENPPISLILFLSLPRQLTRYIYIYIYNNKQKQKTSTVFLCRIRPERTLSCCPVYYAMEFIFVASSLLSSSTISGNLTPTNSAMIRLASSPINF